MKNLKLNSIFLHGFFKTSEVFESKTAATRVGRHSLQIGGNNIQVYRYRRSFTVNLVKNIESFLNVTKLRKAIRKQLHVWLGWKIRKVTAQITNYQASGTFDCCDKLCLYRYIIPHLIKIGGIEKRIRFGETFYAPATDSVWASDYDSSLVENFGFMTLSLSGEQKIKFQVNKKEDKVHITAILDKFDHQVKTICEEIESIATFLKSKDSDENVSKWFKKRERKWRLLTESQNMDKPLQLEQTPRLDQCVKRT